jgi:hypothetical protein
MSNYDYLTLDSAVGLRLSKRLRSCSTDNVSEGVEVFIGGGPAVAAGAEVLRCLAATDAGTNDIMLVGGFGAEAGGALAAALPGPAVLPLF